jgi:hypothetical protein
MVLVVGCTSQNIAAVNATANVPQSPNAVIGVGFVFAPYNLPPDEQETILGQMEHAGVRVVRCSITDGDKGIDFVQRVYAHKIKIVWMVGLTPAEGTPWPHAPEGFKGLWQGYRLSAIDPDRFRTTFSPCSPNSRRKELCSKLSSQETKLTGPVLTRTFLFPARGEF